MSRLMGVKGMPSYRRKLVVSCCIIISTSGAKSAAGVGEHFTIRWPEVLVKERINNGIEHAVYVPKPDEGAVQGLWDNTIAEYTRNGKDEEG